LINSVVLLINLFLLLSASHFIAFINDLILVSPSFSNSGILSPSGLAGKKSIGMSSKK